MRGISRVYAMARPTRPKSERDLVQAAAADLTGMSSRAAASIVARRVAAIAMFEADRDPVDEVSNALAQLVNAIDASPVQLLATCPVIDTQAVVRAVRLAAFEGRGCRHLPEGEWRNEREETGEALIRVLRGRYKRHLKNWS